MVSKESRFTTQRHDPTQDPPTHEEDPILTLGEVSRQLGRALSTVHRWVADGLLAAIPMPSGLKGVRKSTVNKFLGGSAIEKRVIDPQTGE